MVNGTTITRCPRIGFLGLFLNSTGGRKSDLLEYLGLTSQGFCRWFKVDDIRYSLVTRIFGYYGFDVRMEFDYGKNPAPSRATASAIVNMLDPTHRLNPLFVEMKLCNYNYETLGAQLGRTPQGINRWFLEDDTSVKNIIDAARVLGAEVRFVPVKKEK